MKKIIIFILSIGLMLIAVSTLKNKKFYTSEQLETARNKAISQARDGKYDIALHRLKTLSKYDSKNTIIWYDYLTVLHWAGKTNEFFSNLDNVTFVNIPDYFLDSCVSVIKTLNTKTKQKQAYKLFKYLLNNKVFMNTHYFIDMYHASKFSATNSMFLKALNNTSKNLPFLHKIELHELSKIARDGEIDKAIQLFDAKLNKHKNNILFIAEYITVNNWGKKHDKVIEIAAKQEINRLPEYAIQSIADSYKALGNLNKSLDYQQILKNKFNKKKYTNEIEHLKLQIAKEKIVSEKKIIDNKKINFKTQKKLLEKQIINNKEIILQNKQNFLELSFSKIEIALIKKPFSQKLYNRWNKLAQNNGLFIAGSRLTFFEKHLKAHSKNSLFYYDYLVLLSWNKQHQKAITLYKKLTYIQSKSYFYEALAHSAREIKDLQLALELFNKAIEVDTNNNETLIINKANILQELNKPQQAIDILNQLKLTYKDNINILFSLAGAYRQIGKSLFAIDLYNQILLINPLYQAVKSQKAITLVEASLPFFSFGILSQDPELFNYEQKKQIYSELNTYKVKLATDDNDIPQQLIATKVALTHNTKYIDLLNQHHTNNKTALAYAYADKIILHHIEKNYQKVTNLYESTSLVLPNYALNAVSSSYLALKHPEKAVKIAQYAIQNKPNDFNALIDAYYANLELENYSAAFDYLQIIDKNTPIWLYSENGKKSLDNPKKGNIKLLLALHLAYKNNLQTAQDTLENLVEKAPMNNSYRTNLAKIYRWRGWLEKSQEQLNIVVNSDIEYLSLDISQSTLWLDQKHYEKSWNQLNKLMKITPRPDSVNKLNKDWRLHNTNIFSISTEHANTKGATFSSKDKTYSASLYSQPFYYNWRVFGTYRQIFSNFLSQDDHITTQGFGINYRDTWGEASISLFNVEGLKNQEFSLSGTWKKNDEISFNAEYQSFSNNTPVRAFHSGVQAQSLKFGASYSPNKAYNYRGNISVVDLSDGNKRASLSLSAYQPLYRNEHHLLSIYEYAYAQHNSLDTNRAYFNPQSLYSLSSALDYTGIINRKYDNVFSHSARVGFGYVLQNDFSAQLFLDFSYLHRWDLSKYFHLFYGIGFRQNHYDGVKENGPNFKAGLEYRF